MYIAPMSHLEERWLAAWLFRSLDSAPTINRRKPVRDFATDEKMLGVHACTDWFSYQITVLESVCRRCESSLWSPTRRPWSLTQKSWTMHIAECAQRTVLTREVAHYAMHLWFLRVLDVHIARTCYQLCKNVNTKNNKKTKNLLTKQNPSFMHVKRDSVKTKTWKWTQPAHLPVVLQIKTTFNKFWHFCLSFLPTQSRFYHHTDQTAWFRIIANLANLGLLCEEEIIFLSHTCFASYWHLKMNSTCTPACSPN